MLSILLWASITFITIVSKLSLFCSVIWDQIGGISSKQTWIRTFIMAQLDLLPTSSSHTPMERLQRKLRGWRWRLLSHWGLHHSILSTIYTVSYIWELFIRQCETPNLCVFLTTSLSLTFGLFLLEHSVVLFKYIWLFAKVSLPYSWYPSRAFCSLKHMDIDLQWQWYEPRKLS